MISRINSDDERLSSIANLYVGLSGYYDWVNSLAHAYEITKLPMYSGNYYPDAVEPDEQIHLGLLATPFTNEKPYDTDLLSANIGGTPGSDLYARGKYRAWKWLTWAEKESLLLHENWLIGGQLRNGPGYEIRSYSYYPAPLLKGQRIWTEISSGLSGDVMASIFDAWPGKYSYDSYNQMWVNFYQCAVCGADVDWNGIEGTSVQPPLYDNELHTLNQFRTNGNQVWELNEFDTKANNVMSILSSDLMANDRGWLGGCSLGIYNFGNKLFHYGQTGFSDDVLRAGIAYPLLKFVDFWFDDDGQHKYSNKITDIVADAVNYAGDFTERLTCPDLLSAAMQIELSSPYPAYAGAGTDQFGRLMFRRGQKIGYEYDYFQANPKLLYAGYVSICDLYRTFCTMQFGPERRHNRWATVENKWSIGDEMQIEREIRHTSFGSVTNVTIYDDRAEVDIAYDDMSYVWKDLSSEVDPGDNTIIVSRNQVVTQFDEGDAMNFVRSAQLDMTSCFVTTPDPRPNPDLPQETQDWINSLFPPDPEEKRQQDLTNLQDEFEEDLEKLQEVYEDIEEQIGNAYHDYAEALNNADVDLLKDAFTHFGYEIPQPVPHWPPMELEYDYYQEWFYPGVINVTNNDPNLPTEDQKVQRQEEMYQYVSDMEDTAWRPGGTLYEIYQYWMIIISPLEEQLVLLRQEMDQRIDQFEEEYDKILTDIYHPEIPDQSVFSRIADYITVPGGITAIGEGRYAIQTAGMSKVIAPLSGYTSRKYLGLYGQWELSDNSLYWPAPAIMLGPEKDGIFVEEYLPYKMQSYAGDLMDINRTYELSDTVWSSFVGYDSGLGYRDMMSNEKRNKKMYDLLHSTCPIYWSSPYGNIDGYQGEMPTPPDIPSRTEHQVIEFEQPEVIIQASENLDPDTQHQVTLRFNGEERSNLNIRINGKVMLMSDLINGAIELGSAIVGNVTITPDRIDPNLLRFWKSGPNSEYYKYQQCNFYLRGAQFTLR